MPDEELHPGGGYYLSKEEIGGDTIRLRRRCEDGRVTSVEEVLALLRHLEEDSFYFVRTPTADVCEWLRRVIEGTAMAHEEDLLP